MYPWKRYLAPRDQIINLDDNGFLYDPEDDFNYVFNEGLLTLEEANKHPAIVLLGAQGTGKSYVLRNLYDETRKTQRCLYVDLRSYGDEQRLVQDLFYAQDLGELPTNGTPFYLFLDSYDECLIELGYLGSLLANELARLDKSDQLYIRIACRDGAWQETLEKALISHWGNEGVGIYELAPLRRKDVLVAAEQEGINSARFENEITDRDVGQLAVHPITLSFLLRQFINEGTLSNSRTKLYENGCLFLCEESEPRIEAGHGGSVSATQRLDIASIVAATLMFCGRDSVFVGGRICDAPVESLHIDDLCRKTVDESGNSIALNRSEISETLKHSALFSSQGQNVRSFAHRSYAEYLAARCIEKSSINESEILKLVRQGDSQDRQVIPQLYGVTAFLAGLSQHVFDSVVETNPEILLQSDEIYLDSEKRKKIVKQLLHKSQNMEWVDSDWSIRKHYKKLKHQEIAKLLKGYVLDKNKNQICRRIAIDIAEECSSEELLTDLVSIALDETENYHVRKQAADAVSAYGTISYLRALRPLVFGDPHKDPDDELRGLALKALWPKYISVNELVVALKKPKPSFIGAYFNFLEYDLISGVNVSDIPVLLDWVIHLPNRWGLEHGERTIVDKLMEKAWYWLDQENVLDSFAKAAWSRLEQHDSIFGDNESDLGFKLIETDKDKRRSLITALAPYVQNPAKQWWMLSSLIVSEDISWLLDWLESKDRDEIKVLVAQLVTHGFDRSDVVQVNSVLDSADSEPILKEAIGPLIEPVSLNSDEAKAQKEYFTTAISNRKKVHKMEPPPTERIEACLSNSEQGKMLAWEKLGFELMLEETSRRYTFPGYEVMDTPGWKNANANTRRRIVDAAKRYLEVASVDLSQYSNRTRDYSMVAGYTALHLVQQQDPKFFEDRTLHFWQKWCVVLLDPYVYSEKHNDEICQNLLLQAKEHASEVIVQTIEHFVDLQIKEGEYLSIRYQAETVWDQALDVLFFNRLKSGSLNDEQFRNIADSLLGHKSERGVEFCKKALNALTLGDSDERNPRALIVAELLLKYADDESWPTIRNAINYDIEFGRSLFLRYAASIFHLNHRSRFTETELGELFVWLSEHFNLEQVDDRESELSRTKLLDLREFRNRIVTQLQDRGTEQACTILKELASKYEDYGWIKWRYHEAINKRRAKMWLPPSPSEFLQVLNSVKMRLVNTADDLLEVIVESLDKLQEKLHGVTPQVQYLWDEISDQVRRPKSEPAFSDFVKSHLKDHLAERGIIANREVEVFRGAPKGIGESTDIYVSALVKEANNDWGSCVVVIECKGCWNPKLLKDMEQQLKNRYLIDNKHRHGLYLVGWYRSDKWDTNDRRQSRCKLTLCALKSKLLQQAQELSDERFVISSYVLNVKY